MVIENIVAFLLALGLEKPSRFNTVMRTVFFLPVLISPLAAGYVFLSILQTQGALNGILGAFTTLVGLPVPQVEWLASTTWTLVLIAFIHAWKFGGIHMLVYIAGLKAIPHEVVEAATIDGASRWDLDPAGEDAAPGDPPSRSTSRSRSSARCRSSTSSSPPRGAGRHARPKC